MTATTVSYHRDAPYGEGRPAINVKVHAPGVDYWPDVFRSDPPIAPDGLIGDYEPFVEQANEALTERFWADAAAYAEHLGLGPIEQEGRSGGWLVLTDGRDPQDGGWHVHHWLDCYSTGDAVKSCGQMDATAWLAAYRQFADWCAEQVRTAPQRVAALAQQLAMDELGAEPARRMWATHRRQRTLREARASGDMHPYWIGVQL